MTLTIPKSQDDLPAFPTMQLFLLGELPLLVSILELIPSRVAIVRLAEPVALTSIFPYAWNCVKNYNIGSGNDASFYAGVLISAFALSESLTGMFWGALSDRVGRKPILLVGCTGTIISMLMVGVSNNFWFALVGRSLGGLLNGNIGVIQTMVAELVKCPEHERKRCYTFTLS